MHGFDDRTRALLEGIARTGSVAAAARLVGMDPSNARRHLRTAEARAGAALVQARRGGAARGAAWLTRAGRARLGPGARLTGRALAFEPDAGTTPVLVGRRVLHVAGRVREGPVELRVRPEDVLLARRWTETSARNALRGSVASVRPAAEGTFLVDVAAGALRVQALVTRGALRELRLKEGSRVVAAVKATALRATALR